MSIVKVIEVIASSEKSIEDALQQAVAEASKTIRNIDSVYVKDIKAHVKDGKISSYGLITKISFRLDESAKDGEASQAGVESEATPQASQNAGAGAANVTPKVPQQTEATEAETASTPEASQQEDSEQISSEERYKQGVTVEQEAQPQAQSEAETEAQSQQQAQAGSETQPKQAQSEAEAQPQQQAQQEQETQTNQDQEELEGEESEEEKEKKPAHQKDFVPAH